VAQGHEFIRQMCSRTSSRDLASTAGGHAPFAGDPASFLAAVLPFLGRAPHM
jgi:hypothetical protein